jgi:type I restriction enzyme, S subunit
MSDRWRHVTMGDVLKQRDERSWPGDTLLSVTAKQGVIRHSDSGRRDTSNVDKSKYRRVRRGDIVYNTMRMWQGVSAVSHLDGIVSPAYTVCRPSEDVDANFLAHLLKVPSYVVEFKKRSQGLVSDTWNLKYRMFSVVPVSLPPMDEQGRIAEVLDDLDSQIRLSEQIISKLRLVRQGVSKDLFQGAVAGSMKPLRELASISGGVALGSEPTGPGTIRLPYLRVANVQDGRLDLSDVKYVRISVSDHERFSLAAGDVLMNEGGDADKLGRGTVWENQIEGCIHQNHVFRVRTDRRLLDPWFLAYFSGSPYGKSYFLGASKQTTNLATINSTQIGLFSIPMLTLDEQRRIVGVISSLDERLFREECGLEKLNKLKTGLTFDLVMGRAHFAVGAAR